MRGYYYALALTETGNDTPQIPFMSKVIKLKIPLTFLNNLQVVTFISLLALAGVFLGMDWLLKLADVWTHWAQSALQSKLSEQSILRRGKSACQQRNSSCTPQTEHNLNIIPCISFCLWIWESQFAVINYCKNKEWRSSVFLLNYR